MPDAPQANGSAKDPQGTQTPEALNEEAVVRIVNAAISARNKGQDAKVEKMLGDFMSKLETSFAERQATQPAGDAKPDANKSATSIEDSPVVKGLLKQLDALKKEQSATKAERDAERASARDVKLRQLLADKLATVGITDAVRAKHAIGHLVDASKAVRFGDGDELVFKDGKEDVDLETGLKSWVSSDEAKIYLPPRGTQGSGAQPRPGGNGTPAGSGPSLGERLASLIHGA